ncbi:hypothetical protein G9A89_000957 [Geosiphon pyriformis]|nr:hypothetical protein G9A89_000957 [Geosiphon pyriformis]
MSTNLHWSHLVSAKCAKYGKSGQMSLVCAIDGKALSDKPSCGTLSDDDKSRLATIYAKCLAPITCPVSFGGLSWAKIAGRSSFPLLSGQNVSASLGSSLKIKPSLLVMLEVNKRFTVLERGLASLMEQIGKLAKRLDILRPMVSQPCSGCQPLVTLSLQDQEVDVAMSKGSGMATSSETAVCKVLLLSPNIVKLKETLSGLSDLVMGLMAKVEYFFTSMTKLIWKVVMCNVRGMNIANKFDDVRVFISGLNSGYSGVGVAVIMDISLACHVCKISEVSGRLLSVKLLFKGKLLVSILGLYAGASLVIWFSQTGNINSLIAKTVNESFFTILGGDFNKDGSRKCASFKKCLGLGLNSRGVKKMINYVLVFLNLVNAIIHREVSDFGEHFKMNHQAVSVSLGLGGLLDVQLNFLRKQTKFKSAMTANTTLFFDDFFKDYVGVFTKESSKFHKLELLISKLVRAFWSICCDEFILLLDVWSFLNNNNAFVVRSFFLFGSFFDTVRSALFRVRKTYCSLKLAESKCVVLDHLVVDDELILEPGPVKSKPLDYVFDEAFSDVMQPIKFLEFFGMTAGLSGISNKLWKHSNRSVLDMLLVFLNFCLSHESVPEGVLMNTQSIALIKTACKILSKIFFDRISLVCSTYDILHGDNFSVLKSTTTQTPIFAINLVVEDALEKNRELWLVLQDMCKAYNSVGWEHLKKCLVRIKMCGKFIRFFGDIHRSRTNQVITDFGLTNSYRVHDRLDQGEVFSSLLWHIFYDPLLCEVKHQKSAGLSSFFAAGAFVDDTIWIDSSHAATQHILDIANEFFRINDILINNDFCLFSSVPSLAKAHLDVCFFNNLVLKRVVSDKQFLYLVLTVLHPIISYRMQFSFVPVGVCNKWNALIRKGLKLKSGLSFNFSSDTIHYPSFYGLKSFSQCQSESKVASLISFANFYGVLGQLFSHKSHDLQILYWHPIHPLSSSACIRVSVSNNFLSSMVCIFFRCNLSLGGSLASSFWLCDRVPISCLLSDIMALSLWISFRIIVKRLDPRGPVSEWFELSVVFLSGLPLSLLALISVGSLNIFGSGSLSVYMDGSLKNLGMLDCRAGAVAFFKDINLGLSISVCGLVSSTLVELQAIALALECIPASCSAALDACKSELGLVCPDFHNQFWVECQHIRDIIYNKNLKVSWHKIKGHFGILGNNYANSFVDAASFSNWFLPPSMNKHFLLANGGIVFGNSRHFVQDVFCAVCCAHWEVGSGSGFLVGDLLLDVNWFKFFQVWHLDSHMATGFISKHTTNSYTYFMKALHHWLFMAVQKQLYNKCYPSVFCLYCEVVEVSDHMFFYTVNSSACNQILKSSMSSWKELSGLFFFSHVLFSAFFKSFVFNGWFPETVFVFYDPKIAGVRITNFAHSLCLTFRNDIWLVHAKHHIFMEKCELILMDGSVSVSISGSASKFLAGVIKLLGISKAFGIPTSGSVSSDSSYKVKNPSDSAKLSSNSVALKSNGSGQVVGQFNSMDTDRETSESEGVSDSKMNTPQTKHFNNGAIFGSLFGFINFDMEEEEEVEVAVKKSFALDINLSAVEEISAMAKTYAIRKLFSEINGFEGVTTSSKFEEIIRSTFTSEASIEKAVSLAKENNIIVNSDLKRQRVCSDWAIVIKEILMDTPKEMIIATVSEFGQKDSVHVAKPVRDHKTWASRDWYRALLFTLPVGTMAHDLGNLLAEAGEKTCVINQSLDTGNRVRCAVVCFENDKKLESAFCMEPIFGGCEQCGKLDHSVLKCNTEISISPTIFKSFKRVISNENCLQLAKLYAKKSVPIFRLAVFSSKSWAQIVFLVSLFNSPHFGSGPGFDSSFGASGVVGHLFPAGPISLFLETCLVFLECSLELLMDKMSGIMNKLDSLNLVPLALASSSQLLVVPGLVNMEFDLDMVLDELKSAVLLLSSVSSGAPSSGSSSSKILTSKVGCLKSKLMALEALVCLVLGKLDQMCAGSGSAVSSGNKQFSKAGGHYTLAQRYEQFGLCFWFGSGYLGSGVAIIMNNTLAKHVCKVFEVSGHLLSVKLFFKNKLSVSILGLYAGASVSTHFSQMDKINFLIAKAVNESFFIILGSNFNENSSHKCASFRKCFDLGLVTKTIDYVFVSSSLVNTILDHSVTRVDEYFDTDHKAVTVSVGLGGLLNVNLMSLRKQAVFKESSAATVAMFKCKFDAALLFLDLDAIYDNVFTKKSSKFHKLELLVSKLVKALHLVSFKEFVVLLSMWNSLDATNASVVESLFFLGSHFEVIRSVLFRVRKLYCSSKLSELKHAEESHIRSAVSRRIESFEVDKGHTIRSVLECPFYKVVLDYLVVDNELVLDPSLVKFKVDVIMEGWTRKCELVTDIFADWCCQYQPLKYIFDDVFSRIMDPISSGELLGVVSDLPNDKAAGLSGILNELWKHYDESILNMLLKAWVSMIPKPYEWEGIFSDRISLACSTHNVLCGDNFLVLKSTMIQSPIFAVSSVVEDALEKNCELWLVLQDMKKAYDFVGWEHLKKSLIRIKMCGRFIQFFGGIHNNRVNRVMTDFGLTDGKVFSSLLWHIFYDFLLCKVKRQEEFYGYRLNSHFVAKTGHVELQAGFSFFFAAGAFTAIQHILNIANEFFRINDISINNDKTVAIPINSRVVSPFLTISGALISIVKKREPYWYLGIFLSMGGLSKPSLAKAHLDVWFFTNLVLKKTISNKQFSYLVSVVLHSIISYRTQFSFVPLNVCCKWDALIRKDFKFKVGLPSDFPNNAFHHSSLYGLKTFEQIQAESKLVSVVCFANAAGILGCLFLHRSHDLQTLSWRFVHPLVSPAHLKLNPSNNFLAGVVCIFANCSLSFSGLGSNVFRFSHSILMSLVLGEVKFSKCLSSLRWYRIAFVEQLRHHNGGAFDWKTFKHWKRLDPRGSIPDWFSVSVGYLDSAELFSSVHNCLVGVSFALNVLEFTDFDLVHNCLLGWGADSLSVYTDGSLTGLGTLSVKSDVVVFFDDINMGLGVRVSGLLSSTLVELQAIALALECVPAVSKVYLFSDSQAALDACKSELVEHRHIANLVRVKRLDVSWCKIKRHSGVIGNDRADEQAGHMAFSDFQFILAGGSSVSGNFRHFVCDIYQFIHHLYWGFGSSTRVVTGELLTDINWHRSFSVWHPDSYMAAGFTSIRTAGLCMYFIKALHHRLPVAICKRLYDRSYLSVVCLYCECVEVSDHVFSCISGLHCPFSHVLRTLSSCIVDTSVRVALCKGFVFNDWFFEVVSVFGDLKLAGAKIVDFVRDFCLAFRDKVWLVHSSMPVTISGLSSLYSAGVVKLLGIDNALSVRFGLHKFNLFISGALNMVSIHIDV